MTKALRDDLNALVRSGRIRIYDEAAPIANRYRRMDDSTKGLLEEILRESGDESIHDGDATSDRSAGDHDSSADGDQPNDDESTTEMESRLHVGSDVRGDTEGLATGGSPTQESTVDAVVPEGRDVRTEQTKGDGEPEPGTVEEVRDADGDSTPSDGSESGSSTEVHEDGPGLAEELHHGTLDKFSTAWD